MRCTTFIVARSAIVLLSFVLAPAVSAQLQRFSDTLTTYTADPTLKQGVKPLAIQRAVNYDGSPKAGGAGGPTPFLKPFGDRAGGACGSELGTGPIFSQIGAATGGVGGGNLNGVDLSTGIFPDARVHLHLPQPGADWVISVDYNPRQDVSGGFSNGFQGANRFQGSAMELQFPDADTLYFVWGANRYMEFRRVSSTDYFAAVNGGTGMAHLATAKEDPDKWTIYDVVGNKFTFFGDDDDSNPVKGQLWMIEDAAGNKSYVGDDSGLAEAITAGYDGNGNVTTTYDAVGRRYTYDYNGNGYLESVGVEVDSGGWTEVARVEYSYYVDAETHGGNGDLKLVKVTIPLTDSGATVVQKTYYRYYEGTFHATSNPGHPHQIKYIYEGEALRQLDWVDGNLTDDDFIVTSNEDLKAYASAFFEYNVDKQISKAWFNGACGCVGGGGSGTYTFSYVTNTAYSPPSGSGYQPQWATQVVIREPEKRDQATVYRWVTQYFDEVGQPLTTMISDGDPSAGTQPNFWATVVKREATGIEGFVSSIHSPANVSAYNHTTGEFTTENSVGLVTVFSRITSDHFAGYLQHTKFKKGKLSSNPEYLQSSVFLTAGLHTFNSTPNVSMERVVVASATVYTVQDEDADPGPGGGSPPPGAYRTEFTYDFYDDGDENAPLVIEDVITTYPIVSDDNNGSDAATSERTHFRKEGLVDFAKAPDGTITYSTYTNGQLAKAIQDADTTQTGVGADFYGVTIPSGYATGTPSAAFHLKTTYTYDRAGRLEKTTQYKSNSGTIEHESLKYVSKLKDDRFISLHYPLLQTGPKYYGPIQMTVTNHVGGVVAQSLIALNENDGLYTDDAQSTHVDELESDPILAIDIGKLTRMTVQLYDETGGRVEESRAYFSTPLTGDGTKSINYDSTVFGYDNSGRRWRVKEPTGTIRRTKYDVIGRVIEQWVGTNDQDFPDGETGGTADMVKIEALVYDSTADRANGLITKRTLYVEAGETGKRETNYLYDLRGRMLLQTNPTAPHTFNKYDNVGRLIASGQFSSTANIDITSDDPTGESSNRMALFQSSYDEKGQLWRTQQHKIDDTGGTDLDNLQDLTWYDAAGRIIKRDGGELTKMFYDRLGRPTHQFILGSIGTETAYADADDVSGDIVLEEHQTTYDRDTGLVIMSATIERLHDDYSTGETTGALDTNADGDALLYTASNLQGRIQITANWYDDLDRLQDTVNYGTHGGSDFDRDEVENAPPRSDTALVTTYGYAADGSISTVTDAKGRKTTYTYDTGGRLTRVISNYVDGEPSNATADDDAIVKYSYTDGLRTMMWVDLYPEDESDDFQPDAADEVTTWSYGVIKGTSAGDSKIGAKHLLYKVVYPPQSVGQGEADRRVLYAYNAQGQVNWMKDQTGTIVESAYDTSGRNTHQRVTTLDTASGLDNGLPNTVLRISTTYDSLGRRQLVTQYDNATVGSGTILDEVKFAYDDWGNIEKVQQDRDSAVGGSGFYEVSYTYEKAGSGSENGRNTLRRTGVTLPSGNVLVLNYSSTGNLHDAWASRVTEVIDSGVVLSEYRYNGSGSVVGIDLHDVTMEIFNHRYSGTSGSYPDLDRFNRVTSDTWWRNLSTDIAFHDVDIFYDRNSNITRTEDLVFTPSISAGWDASYTMDNLNRLTKDEQGDWNGTSITNRSRQQIWTLDQVGNWNKNRLDRNGDNDFIDTGGEVDDLRTHYLPNELIDRDLDTDGDGQYDDTHYDLTYNKRGDLTDDGQPYEYVYDAFGRLRQVRRTDNQAVVREYRYNGLNHRLSWKYDTDVDRDVDTSDKTFYFAYDERWRILATFRESDTSPKEEYVYHAAGNDGSGSSSYIDTVILRDKDASTAWAADAADAMDQRYYYCHNWRGDVAVMISAGGTMGEWVRYSAYGIPYGIPAIDTNGDGTVNSTDQGNLNAWWGTGTGVTHPTGDVNLDGNIDVNDLLLYAGQSGTTLGWGTLSTDTTNLRLANRKGYAGYEFEPVLAYSIWHVRHRVLNSDLGRWTTRDQDGYSDGTSLYLYASASPVGRIDPWGLDDYDWYLCEKYCCKWAEKEAKSLGWLSTLPNCPCSLPASAPGTPAVAPPGWEPDRRLAPLNDPYHPGASHCIRSAGPAGSPGQQCCYDKNGWLITGGEGAGTPDRVAPGWRWRLRGNPPVPVPDPLPFLEHWHRDVDPFDICKGTDCLEKYLQARPPNNGNNCIANVIRPVKPCQCYYWVRGQGICGCGLDELEPGGDPPPPGAIPPIPSPPPWVPPDDD